MANTMRGFSRRLREISDAIPNNTNKMMRRTIITVASAVVLRTPVDTGRARANWRTNIGGPLTSVNGNFPAGKKGSSGMAAAGQAIQEATAKAQSYNTTGVDVYISNNLPYIGQLNSGSSKQAPAGFIESSIAAGLRAIRKARLVQ